MPDKLLPLLVDGNLGSSFFTQLPFCWVSFCMLVRPRHITLFCRLRALLVSVGVNSLLVACVYKLSFSVGKVTPGGALAAVLFGSILRAVLEFALPKDDSLVIPRGEFNFDYGPGQVSFLGILPSYSVHTLLKCGCASRYTCEQHTGRTSVEFSVPPDLRLYIQ